MKFTTSIALNIILMLLLVFFQHRNFNEVLKYKQLLSKADEERHRYVATSNIVASFFNWYRLTPEASENVDILNDELVRLKSKLTREAGMKTFP